MVEMYASQTKILENETARRAYVFEVLCEGVSTRFGRRPLEKCLEQTRPTRGFGFQNLLLGLKLGGIKWRLSNKWGGVAYAWTNRPFHDFRPQRTSEAMSNDDASESVSIGSSTFNHHPPLLLPSIVGGARPAGVVPEPPGVFDMHDEQEGRLRLIDGQLQALTDEHRTGSMRSIGQRLVQLEHEQGRKHAFPRLRALPGLNAEARRAEAFVAKRLAQRFVALARRVEA